MAPTIEEIVAMYHQALQPGAQVVSIVDAIIDGLIQVNLANRQVLKPKRVGVNKLNRDEVGLLIESVIAIGEQVDNDGFSLWACAMAVCFEDDDERSHAKFTIDMCNAEPSLASFALDEVDHAAVACTHFNQFLCAAVDSVPCDVASIAVMGRISTAKIEAKNPRFGTAIREGIEWVVIKKQVTKLMPELARIIQDARNRVGKVQHNEDQWQVLKKMMRESKTQQQGTTILWDVVEARVKASKPTCMDDIAAYKAFLHLYPSHSHVDDLVRFTRKYCKLGSIVPGSLFQAIASIRLAPDELAADAFFTIVKTCAQGPKIEDKVCKTVTASMVVSFCKDRKNLKNLQSTIAKCKELCSKSGCFEGDINALLDKYTILVTRKMMGIPLTMKSYPTVNHVLADFCKDLCDKAGSNIRTPAEWRIDSEPASSGKPKRTDQLNIDNLDLATRAKLEMLQQLKFEVGVMLVCCTPGSSHEPCATIEKFTKQGDVVVRKIDSKVSATIPHEEFVTTYQFTDKVLEWVPADFPQAHMTLAAKVVSATAKIHHLLLAATTEVVGVKAREKPTRMVATTKEFKKNELKLWPVQMRSPTVVKHSDKRPAMSLIVKAPLEIELSGYEFHLTPHHSKDSISYFWYVRVSHIEAEANLVVEYSKAVEGVQFPCLTNKKAVKAGVELVRYHPSPIKEEKKRGQMTADMLIAAPYKKARDDM
jgi:hypothetical protein